MLNRLCCVALLVLPARGLRPESASAADVGRLDSQLGVRPSISRRGAGAARPGAAGLHPAYELPSTYTDPLGVTGVQLERDMMHSLSEERYSKYLHEMVDPASRFLQVKTRSWTSKKATLDVVRFLREEFEDMGVTTCVQEFKSWPHEYNDAAGGKDIYNVIAFIPGRRKGSVTLGAHFDDRPYRGRAPGAVDNGSGVAAVLAAARSFSQAKARPLKSVYFVAFGGEEENLYGSDRFAQELFAPGSTDSPIPAACRTKRSKDHIAITMDMIGWRNPAFPVDTVTMETHDWSSSMLPHLAQSNAVNNGDRLKLLAAYDPYGSDHESFLKRGLKAALIIDNDGDEQAYPCYHKACDTIENVNIALATEISRMNLGGLLRLAGLAE